MNYQGIQRMYLHMYTLSFEVGNHCTVNMNYGNVEQLLITVFIKYTAGDTKSWLSVQIMPTSQFKKTPKEQ